MSNDKTQYYALYDPATHTGLAIGTASLLAKGFNVAECQEPSIAVIFKSKALGDELKAMRGRWDMEIRPVPIVLGKTYLEYEGVVRLIPDSTRPVINHSWVKLPGMATEQYRAVAAGHIVGVDTAAPARPGALLYRLKIFVYPAISSECPFAARFASV